MTIQSRLALFLSFVMSWKVNQICAALLLDNLTKIAKPRQVDTASKFYSFKLEMSFDKEEFTKAKY